MSRSTMVIVFGALVFTLLFGLLIGVLFGFSLFRPGGDPATDGGDPVVSVPTAGGIVTPTPAATSEILGTAESTGTIEATAEASATAQASATVAASATATTPPTATHTPLPTNTATPVPTATPIVVVQTPTRYVLAREDVNMRSGPGTYYNVIGWLAGGQIAAVTGASSDGNWWRVVCPDGTTGSCWVTARSQYTQPTTLPTVTPIAPTPTATSIPAGCTDSAAWVADVTVPDGTQFPPNTGFNKTWRIRNTGTCTWDGNYRLVHAGGHLLGAISTSFPVPAIVRPNETVDLTVSMVSPAIPDNYQSDWKLQNPAGRAFGVGRNGGPFWVKIVVVTTPLTTISGVVYQDTNQNGVYNPGEPLVAGREVWLVEGTACHVQQDAVAITFSDGSGSYVFSGEYDGSYCVGLAGAGGLDDVVAVTVTAGQALAGINLRAPSALGSITGFLWNDYCLTTEDGDPVDGNCVADENGDYHADGMIQPTEGYIPGVFIRLQAGSCVNNSNTPLYAVTDIEGRYFFGDLPAGAYCVSMNAAEGSNAAILLPGDWTFPGRGIWYQEIILLAGDHAYPVNFGWDYQLN